MNTRDQRFVLVLCALLAVLVAGTIAGGYGQAPITLVATGSSLPELLYVAWGDEYHRLHPAVQRRYLPEGIGNSGQRILAAASVNWGEETRLSPTNNRGMPRCRFSSCLLSWQLDMRN